MIEEILKARYYQKDENGNPIEDWTGLCKRVSKALSTSQQEEEDFFDVLHKKDFLVNTPALVNAGVNKEASFSACFVLPVTDSIDGIFDAVKLSAKIHKFGGGTGFNFSALRPAGSMVKTTKGVASGPVSFAKCFNAMTETIKQGGVRRGANMAILNVDHPDIFEFVNAKLKEGEFANFNFSVAITDHFMNCVKEDKDIELKYNNKVYKRVKAKDLWLNIVRNAWHNGEPGLIFIDKINKHNVLPEIGKIEATNPCGEQPLLPYEACVLGSINLSQMVEDGVINYSKLERVINIAVRILDNIIDIQAYPFEEIEKMHKSNRKIGLGVMGFADMLIKLKVKYNSQKAVDIAEKVMSFINQKSIEVSAKLAEERGVFPNFDKSIWKDKHPMRNATTTTIAPTGSISLIAGVSSGIEPVFMFVSEQTRADITSKVFHPLYKEWIDSNPSSPLPEYFIEAKDIPVEWHLAIQNAFQKHTQNAVSKTINLPAEATINDVERAFLMAYESDIKGITVYRDGSRTTQVIKTPDTVNTDKTIMSTLPPILPAKRVCIETPEGKVYINVSFLDEKPVEIFTTCSPDSKHADIYEAFAGVFSIALRYGAPLKKLLKQIHRANAKFGSVASVTGAILRAFRMLGYNGDKELCPDCGNELVPEEGCFKCKNCGFSKC